MFCAFCVIRVQLSLLMTSSWSPSPGFLPAGLFTGGLSRHSRDTAACEPICAGPDPCRAWCCGSPGCTRGCGDLPVFRICGISSAPQLVRYAPDHRYADCSAWCRSAAIAGHSAGLPGHSVPDAGFAEDVFSLLERLTITGPARPAAECNVCWCLGPADRALCSSGNCVTGAAST